MRILIINSEYPPIGGGAANASANLAREFAALSHDVTVLTVHFNNLPKKTLENSVRIIRLKSLRRKLDQSGGLEQLAFMIVGSIGTLSLIRQWRPDVTLAFFGVPSGVPAWFAQQITRIPYVVSLRGGDVPGFRPYDFAVYHRLISPILRPVWHRASSVVANSKGLFTLAKNFDGNVDIKIVPNGVDVDKYKPPDYRNWSTPKMLWVGRLVYQKGLDFLLDSLETLKNLSWELTLIGDGPQRGFLEKTAQEKGISDRIIFKGWLNRDELTRYYDESNLFVFPSRHEGMPNAVLEAMASGLPVIATEIAGNEELVIPGVTGLLVPMNNPSELALALGDILVDPERRQQMGFAARERVKTSYTWNQVAISYLSILESIMDK